jgi:hypothetical protein
MPYEPYEVRVLMRGALFVVALLLGATLIAGIAWAIML